MSLSMTRCSQTSKVIRSETSSLVLHTPKIHLVSRLCAQQVPDAKGTWSGCPTPGRAQLSPAELRERPPGIRRCPSLPGWAQALTVASQHREPTMVAYPATSAAGSPTNKYGHKIPQGSAIAQLQMSALPKKRVCTAMPPMVSGVTNSTYCYKNSHQSVSKHCLSDPF